MKNFELTQKIIGIAFNVHSNLGPGLLESSYKQCLFYDLKNSGLSVELEKPVPLIYKNVHLECGYRIDLLVENTVVIEIKSVENILPVHLAQVITYLKLGNFDTGLLMNFNVDKLKNGLRRVYNNK